MGSDLYMSPPPQRHFPSPDELRYMLDDALTAYAPRTVSLDDPAQVKDLACHLRDFITEAWRNQQREDLRKMGW